jgi:MFS family permease
VRGEASSAYPTYVLILLTVVYVFNWVDRNILSILLEDIRVELNASDTAMGLLSGFAFAAFYSVLGLPIARWADRGNRRTLLALGLLIWSAMTAVSGTARSFGALALARIGVGVGEAAGSPPSHSLISDYFPPERRGRALSVYAMGNYAGVFVGFVIGGWINELYGWRAAFLAMGLPGILLAVLVRFTVREPERGRYDGGVGPADVVPVREALRFLRSQRSYVWLNAAGALAALVGYGFGIWAPTYMRRVHGMGTGEIGSWIGPLAALGGLTGTFLGGWLVDRLTRREPRWYLWLPVVSMLANLPISFAFALGSKWLAIACYAPHSLLHGLYVGPMFAAMQGVAKPQMRALAVAIHLMIVNIVGLGIGPLAVGALNDALAERLGAAAVRYSLLLVSSFALFAGWLFAIGARTLGRDLAAARSA